MGNEKKLKAMRCPKCGSGNIDEFERAYWFLCRDCGYNAMPNSDEEKARKNFLFGDIQDGGGLKK